MNVLDWLVILAGILGGLGVFFLFAKTVQWGSEREERYRQMESTFSRNQMRRNGQLVEILNRIKSLPEGERAPLWDEYKKLDSEDAQLRAQERRLLAESSGTLSDDAYEMIYGKPVITHTQVVIGGRKTLIRKGRS